MMVILSLEQGEIYVFDTGTGGSGKLSSGNNCHWKQWSKVTFNSSDATSTLNGKTLTKGDSYYWSENNEWVKVNP